MQTWELTTAAAMLNNMPLFVYLPVVSKDQAATLHERFARQFTVDNNSVKIIPLYSSTTQPDKQALMRLRDEELLRRADVILPISISPTGNMAGLVERQIEIGKDVVRKFQVEYAKRSEPMGYRIEQSNINPSLTKFKDSHLIHWTRACNSHWPNERLIDYYRDIICSREYPRSAIATLNRIALSRTIIASQKNMPAGIATVSFSALPPSEAVSLMRWRSRHLQMSLEPYGIGITIEAALRHGIREVTYSEKRQLGNGESWLTQSRGKITDWRKEKEYRHLGNLDLKLFAPEEQVLFCRAKSEAKTLERDTGLATVWMTGYSE